MKIGVTGEDVTEEEWKRRMSIIQEGNRNAEKEERKKASYIKAKQQWRRKKKV